MQHLNVQRINMINLEKKNHNNEYNPWEAINLQWQIDRTNKTQLVIGSQVKYDIQTVGY
jgi:hypothetical protein